MKAAGGFLSKLDEVKKKKILARLQKIFQSRSAPDIEDMSGAEVTRQIRAISDAHSLDDEILRALSTVTVKKMVAPPKAEQAQPKAQAPAEQAQPQARPKAQFRDVSAKPCTPTPG